MYRVCIKGTAHKVVVTVAAFGKFDCRRDIPFRMIKGKPVTVGPTAGKQIRRLGNSRNVGNPLFHCVIHIRNKTDVAVRFVKLPGNNCNCIRLGCTSRLIGSKTRDNFGNPSVIMLCGLHVVEPFSEKLPDIILVCSCPAENLPVAGPAVSFITLRSVCRNIKVISFLSPQNVAEKLIEHRVAAFEPSGPLHF